MTDYIYGYRVENGEAVFHQEWPETFVRTYKDPLRIPVSAIEDLPAPKPETAEVATEDDERIQAWYAIHEHVQKVAPQPFEDDRTGLEYVLSLLPPIPKPALPTTPGSVIHMQEAFWVLNLSEGGYSWWADAASSLEPNAILDRGWDWAIVFDAGASA